MNLSGSGFDMHLEKTGQREAFLLVFYLARTGQITTLYEIEDFEIELHRPRADGIRHHRVSAETKRFIPVFCNCWGGSLSVPPKGNIDR